jgi:hypothetical protein
MARKLVAGVLGGVVLFVWLSLAHGLLGLGSIGVKDIPNEQAIMPVLKANIPEGGFYFFPGLGVGANTTSEQRTAAMKTYSERIANEPSGIMIYHTSGAQAFSPRQLLTEFGTNIVQILLAVLLLGQTRLASFAARWRFVTAAGILASISTNISYWNWYGFPGPYTLGYALCIAAGFLAAGLVVAAMVKPGAGMPLASSTAA